MRTKVAVLQQTVELINEMRKGNEAGAARIVSGSVPSAMATPARNSRVEQLRIWQPFTYMFLHGGFFHLLFNMLALWMFGVELERMWGSRFFVKFYFVAGVGAMSYPRFITYNVVGAFLWGVCIPLAGYFLGSTTLVVGITGSHHVYHLSPNSRCASAPGTAAADPCRSARK